MDIVFSDASLVSTPTSSVWDHQALLHTLQQAAEWAVISRNEIIASFVQPLHSTTSTNPLSVFRVFQQLQLGECIFWSRPVEQRALVGVGSVATIETQGATSVSDAALAWRELQERIITGNATNVTGNSSPQSDGPVLLGGFAFDPVHTHTELWQGFPDGLLILPRFLFHCDEQGAALTLNIAVQPEMDYTLVAHELVGTANAIMTLLAREPSTSPLREEHLECQVEMSDLLLPGTWKQIVADAIDEMRQGAYDKVVLARAVQMVNRQRSFDIAEVLQRLSISYPCAYVFALQRSEHYFVGATPERLICARAGTSERRTLAVDAGPCIIQTMALAGSAPRGATEIEDEQFGMNLLKSEKNQIEHRVVVETVRTALSTLCSRVWVANEPHLLKLKNIQHLETPITGDLLPGHSILEAIEDLHPTPAVGGYPRHVALETIRRTEQLDRGWYAGPIGWIGAGGSGEFAVALRSGLIAGGTATLFAGCGIVADSEPESEYAESCLKLQVMLRGLL
jgi:isochorismate synthase